MKHESLDTLAPGFNWEKLRQEMEMNCKYSKDPLSAAAPLSQLIQAAQRPAYAHLFAPHQIALRISERKTRAKQMTLPLLSTFPTAMSLHQTYSPPTALQFKPNLRHDKFQPGPDYIPEPFVPIPFAAEDEFTIEVGEELAIRAAVGLSTHNEHTRRETERYDKHIEIQHQNQAQHNLQEILRWEKFEEEKLTHNQREIANAERSNKQEKIIAVSKGALLGIQAGAISSAAASCIDNSVAVYRGEKRLLEAGKDLVKDVFIGSVIGGVSGAAVSACHQYGIMSAGQANWITPSVLAAKEMAEEVVHYCTGAQNGSETSAKMLAKAGQVVGGILGGIVGSSSALPSLKAVGAAVGALAGSWAGRVAAEGVFSLSTLPGLWNPSLKNSLNYMAKHAESNSESFPPSAACCKCCA